MCGRKRYACIYVTGRERETREKECEKSAKECEKTRERRHKSIVVQRGDTRIYTRNYTRANTHENTYKMDTRDIYGTQKHAILYIYDSIDDGAAHSHSVSRIVPQNFSFEFASRNLLFSNV